MLNEKSTADMDIGEFENLMVADVFLKNPVTGAETASFIQLKGPENPDRVKIRNARIRRAQMDYQATEKVALKSPDEQYEEQTDDLVDATVGWRLKFSGKSHEYSPQAARLLYTDPLRAWLREQMLQALNQRTVFIKHSAAT